MYRKCKNGVKKNKIDGGHRVAFRTKSELEVMDDGYKWRKYGKKSVKNSPNPRQVGLFFIYIYKSEFILEDNPYIACDEFENGRMIILISYHH